MQVVVSHHGRPIKLDLDCSETLRCPLLSFSRLAAHGSEDLDSHQGLLPPCRTAGGRDHSGDDGDDETAVERMPENVVRQPAAEDDTHERSAAHGVAVVADAGSETADDEDEGVLVLRADRWEDSDSDEARESGHRPSTGGAGSSAAANTSSRNRHEDADLVGRNHNHPGLNRPQSRQHAHQQHHVGGLGPVQLVAVLVDGSGKGWMAARRLWSVAEVGFQALSEAGLSAGDIDADQEVSRSITSPRVLTEWLRGLIGTEGCAMSTHPCKATTALHTQETAGTCHVDGVRK